jgi:hypothetical protein
MSNMKLEFIYKCSDGIWRGCNYNAIIHMRTFKKPFKLEYKKL